MEFDPAGVFVRGWGGPGQGYDWPKNEHGIYVDPQGNVWIAGNDAADLVFSPDPAQRHILLADGRSSYIHILSRSDGKPLGSFARHGRQAGEFRSLHNLGTDSKGNLYTGEVGFGRRMQKFVRVD
jgi:hypothetical protein